MPPISSLGSPSATNTPTPNNLNNTSFISTLRAVDPVSKISMLVLGAIIAGFCFLISYLWFRALLYRLRRHASPISPNRQVARESGGIPLVSLANNTNQSLEIRPDFPRQDSFEEMEGRGIIVRRRSSVLHRIERMEREIGY